MQKLLKNPVLLCLIVSLCIVLSGCGHAGAYGKTPEQYAFLWEGGTMGHVEITCESVSLTNDTLYATITFQRKDGRGKASFSKVKVKDQEIEGDNTFTIPVNVNENTEIEAYSTAMSEGHWIHYDIYVGIEDADILLQLGKDTTHVGAITSDLMNDPDHLAAQAPKIIGFTALGEVETQAAYLKIFNYDQDCTLIEIDTSSDTAREGMDAEAMDAMLEKPVLQKDVYKHGVVRYLVVPEGREVPVGLSDQLVIIKTPVSRVYVSGSLSGVDELEQNCENVMVEAQGADQWDLKALISQQMQLIITSSELLPKEAGSLQTDWQSYAKLMSRAEQMEMPVFIDRSMDETQPETMEDWHKAYTYLFGMDD